MPRVSISTFTCRSTRQSKLSKVASEGLGGLSSNPCFAHASCGVTATVRFRHLCQGIPDSSWKAADRHQLAPARLDACNAMDAASWSDPVHLLILEFHQALTDSSISGLPFRATPLRAQASTLAYCPPECGFLVVANTRMPILRPRHFISRS
jgi:hypothetical protein